MGEPEPQMVTLSPETIYDFTNALYNQIGDPEPPPLEATPEQIQKYKDEVEAYAREMLEVFQETSMKDELLWFEFTSTFRPQSIPYMSRATTIRWIEFLTSRNVWVKRRQGYPRARALAECLTRTDFIPVRNRRTFGNGNAIRETDRQQLESQQMGPTIHDNVAERDSVQRTNSRTTSREVEPIQEKALGPRSKQTSVETRVNEPLPRTRIADVLPNMCANSAQNTTRKTANDFKDASGRSTAGHSMGVSGLMRSYNGRARYEGGFDEDLQGALEFFDSMSRVCGLSDNEKVEELPFMLCDDALSFYLNTYRVGDTYHEILQKIIDNYMNAEQRNRTLILWQSLRLSQAMREAPEKSELEVFRSFCNRLAQLQKQLDPAYRTDNFLRDQLIISADNGQISQSLRERVPSTSQEARSRIATFLSSELRSAEAFSVASRGRTETHTAHYSLGNVYGGSARKNLKGYSSRKSQKHEKHGRKLSLGWISGKKGCYVCGEQHLARSRHSPAEIRAAIERMKKAIPSAYLTVTDMAFIVDEITSSHENVAADDVNCVYSSDSDTSDDEDQVMYIAQDDMSLHEDDESHLANAAFLHGRSFHKDLDSALANMREELSIGETAGFKGIYIDTCANRSSVMSYAQYKAYCEEFDVPCHVENHEIRNLKGIGGTSKPLGTATIPVPFKDLNLVIDVTFQIVQDNVPTLLSMKDMIDNGLEISIQNREVMYKHLRQPLTFKNYFLIHKWSRGDISYSLYTEAELKKLHRVFGHPSVQALVNLLKKARPNELDMEARQAIEDLTKSCLICSVNASRPKRFKVTVGTQGLRYNHIVAVDIMYICKRPVLHAVDEATHYNAALFLKRVTSSDVWKAFLRCWSRLYLGPPDFLHVDQGSNFVSREFLDSTDSEGISVLQAPIESPSTMSHVERYHGPLRVAYTKIRGSMPRSERDEDCLQMAVKAVNDTVGPEGLCPTLLVYGSLPRPPRRTPADSQIQRARAIDAAMQEVQREQAKRRVSFALKHGGGPKGKEHSGLLSKLPAGSPVYVFRETSKKWEGSFSFIQIEGETVVVQLPHGRRIFRSHVVKPATNSLLDNHINTAVRREHQVLENNCSLTPPAVPDEELTDTTLTAMFGEETSTDDLDSPSATQDFAEFRRRELAGLRERKTFKVVSIDSVPKGSRIYGSRWVDLLKNVDGETIEKSRLVAQNFRDKGALDIPTKSPTVSRLGQRLAASLASMFPEHTPYIRDVSKAYIQSESMIERRIYLRAPPEMGLGSDVVLLVLKPLYGIPESGLHWFLTYHTHHKDRLNMKTTKTDSCVLYRRRAQELSGVTVLQVDDSFGHGSQTFLEDEERESKRFQCKQRKLLTEGDSTNFNGLTITIITGNVLKMHQEKKLRDVTRVDTQKEFASVRAQIQYIGSCTRPDLCASVQLLANAAIAPIPSDYKKLNKIVERCHETSHIGLKYVPLDMSSLRIALFTDASFANAEGLKSQIGFLIALMDHNNNANIIHYGSSRCKRVTRSVMAAEIHALLYGFDNAFIVKHMLEEILGRSIGIDGYIDSRTVFNVVAKNGGTLEKRLQIDISAMRESHAKGELRYLAWIPGEQNLADGLTKGAVNDSHPLWKVLLNNKIHITPTGWVEGSRANL